MTELNEIALGTCFVSIKNGVTIAQHYGCGGIPITRIETLSNGQFNRNKLGYADIFDTKQYKDYVLDDGDLLMSHINSRTFLGRTVQYHKIGNEQIIHGMNLLRIKTNPQILDATYAYYLFQSPYFKKHIDCIRKDAINQSSIAISDIQQLKLLIHDLSTQKRIASVLSNIDRKIALNRAMNEELEQTARDLYDYWFLQFDFPDANGKPYRSSGGKMVYNPQLKREIPEGWEVKSVGDLLNKVKNTYKVPTKEYLKDGKYPIIDQATDTYFAGWSNTDDAVVTQHPIVVFGDHSCAVKYVDIDFCRGADGTQLICSNDVPTEYLYFAILNTRISSGYARHFSFLKNSSIIIPNSKYLKLYQTQTRPFFKTITSNRMENNNLLKLRDELLPLLMNGQVTIE